MPTEVELKLAVPPEALRALRQRLRQFGRPQRQQTDSRYLDTADFRLARRQAALRLRRSGRRWLQTFKTGEALAALAARGEWETPAPGGRLHPQLLRDSPLAQLLGKRGMQRLAPRFATRFLRETWQVERGEALIEVALDRGVVQTVDGTRTEPLLELELELKRGEPAALLALALELQGGAAQQAGDKVQSTRPGAEPELALRPLPESKAARGVRLAAGISPAPAKANAEGFSECWHEDDSAAIALRAVAAHAADLVAANVGGALASDEPEFIHQARVALRRLRSALRMLGDGGDPFPADLGEELRWLARSLGAARDADVLLLETLPRMESAAGLTALQRRCLRAALQAERLRARAQARSALASPRCARLLLRLVQWSASTAPAGPPLTAVAPRLARRAQRRLAVQARLFAAQSAERRHRVRILAKRLRYALDLLAPALPRKATAHQIERLAKLQDLLGTLNDARVAVAVCARLLPGDALLLKLAAWERDGEARLLPQAERALMRVLRGD
jgi:inorganic triphosphatase YgiF